MRRVENGATRRSRRSRATVRTCGHDSRERRGLPAAPLFPAAATTRQPLWTAVRIASCERPGRGVVPPKLRLITPGQCAAPPSGSRRIGRMFGDPAQSALASQTWSAASDRRRRCRRRSQALLRARRRSCRGTRSRPTTRLRVEERRVRPARELGMRRVDAAVDDRDRDARAGRRRGSAPTSASHHSWACSGSASAGHRRGRGRSGCKAQREQTDDEQTAAHEAGQGSGRSNSFGA